MIIQTIFLELLEFFVILNFFLKYYIKSDFKFKKVLLYNNYICICIYIFIFWYLFLQILFSFVLVRISLCWHHDRCG